VDTIVAEHGVDSVGKMKSLTELKPLFRYLTDPVSNAIYVRRVAEQLIVDEAVVRQALKESGGEVFERVKRSPALEKGASLAEYTLLRAVAQFPEHFAWVSEQVKPSYFREELNRHLADMLWNDFSTHNGLDICRILEQSLPHFEEELRRLVLLDDWDEETPIDFVVKECVFRMREGFIKSQLKAISHMIREAEAGGHVEKVSELMTKKQIIMREWQVEHKRMSEIL